LVGSAAKATGTGINSAAKSRAGGRNKTSKAAGPGGNSLIWIALIAIVLGVLWWFTFGKA
jgi:hypothetical protein